MLVRTGRGTLIYGGGVDWIEGLGRARGERREEKGIGLGGLDDDVVVC